jgi:hypothetical protein
MPKTWTEKLNVKKEPKVVKLEASFSDIPAEFPPKRLLNNLN